MHKNEFNYFKYEIRNILCRNEVTMKMLDLSQSFLFNIDPKRNYIIAPGLFLP